MAPLFFVGVLEMVILTAWTKYVTKTRVLASGVVTIINIVIWYYVLSKIVVNLGNFKLVAIYAVGCALGTMLGTYLLGKFGKAKKEEEEKHFVKTVAAEAETV